MSRKLARVPPASKHATGKRRGFEAKKTQISSSAKMVALQVAPVTSKRVQKAWRPRPQIRRFTVPKSPNLASAHRSRKTVAHGTVKIEPKEVLHRPQRKRLTVPISPNLACARRSRKKAVSPVALKLAPAPSRSMNRALTIPISPDFACAKRLPRTTARRVSSTSKELMDIETKRNEIMEQRLKYQSYHEAMKEHKSKRSQKPSLTMVCFS
jgi:hypothetical protein